MNNACVYYQMEKFSPAGFLKYWEKKLLGKKFDIYVIFDPKRIKKNKKSRYIDFLKANCIKKSLKLPTIWRAGNRYREEKDQKTIRKKTQDTGARKGREVATHGFFQCLLAPEGRKVQQSR